MTELQKRLFALSDPTYLVYQQKVLPNLPQESIIGVRVPALRQFARDYEKEPGCAEFLTALPHVYYEENLLHSFILARIRDFDRCMEAIERFLPYVNCWTITDTMNPKVFGKRKEPLMRKIIEWTASDHPYICRYGMVMLMAYFADEDFRPEQLEIPAGVRSDEYYVRMMAAWYYATLLAKHWEETLPYMEKGRLPEWTRKKAIQKACESFRVSEERKAYLKTLR